MSVTLKDIEQEVKISRQAISAVLNNKSNCRVSEKVRMRIMQVAKEKGYRANFGYKVMRGNATKTAAVIISSERRRNDEFIQHLLLMLLDKLDSLGYAVYSNNNMGPDEKENFERICDLMQRGVEHFIFIGIPVGYKEMINEITSHRKTYIGFQSSFARDLSIDTISGEEEIFRYFQSKVGDNFAFFLQKSKSGIFNPKRLQALSNLYPALTSEDIVNKFVFDIPRMQWEEPSFADKMFEYGYQCAEKAVKTRPGLKAFFFMADSFALGAAVYFHKSGKVIGKDVLLAGINNDSAVQYHVYPISSIEYPVQEVSRILLEEFTSAEPVSRIIKPLVHIREIQPQANMLCSY